jgi:hypothetical protein
VKGLRTYVERQKNEEPFLTRLSIAKIAERRCSRIMERYWNDNDKGKPTYSVKIPLL